MGAEQHRDSEFALKRLGQIHHAALMVRIEADQRFVQKEQSWAADQRLGQQQALSLATGDLGERAPRQLARTDEIERAIDFSPT
jgi:hypothetical protein